MIRTSMRTLLLVITALCVTLGVHISEERACASRERDVITWLADHGRGHVVQSARQQFDLFSRIHSVTMGGKDLESILAGYRSFIQGTSKQIPVSLHDARAPVDMTPLASLTRVTEITVYFQRVEHVDKLAKCRQLESLNLMGCSVNDEEIRMFQRQRPNCRVTVTRAR